MGFLFHSLSSHETCNKEQRPSFSPKPWGLLAKWNGAFQEIKWRRRSKIQRSRERERRRLSLEITRVKIDRVTKAVHDQIGSFRKWLSGFTLEVINSLNSFICYLDCTQDSPLLYLCNLIKSYSEAVKEYYLPPRWVDQRTPGGQSVLCLFCVLILIIEPETIIKLKSILNLRKVKPEKILSKTLHKETHLKFVMLMTMVTYFLFIPQPYRLWHPRVTLLIFLLDSTSIILLGHHSHQWLV